MVDAFRTGAVEAHVVVRPAEAECVAAGDEFAEEVGKRFVVGVLSGGDAEGGDDAVGASVR